MDTKNRWFRISVALCVIVVLLLIAVIVAGVVACGGNTDCEKSPSASIEKDSFGSTGDGEAVDRYTMKNQNGMTVQIITYGGTITSIVVPDKNGDMADVALGYDKLDEYLVDSNPYFGALIGRVANRIAVGEFTLDGVKYHLNINNHPNHLHGGPKGWSKVVWKAETKDGKLLMSHFSPDGDEHYPGDVTVDVIYELTNDNAIIISYSARVSGKATPINLSSHSYFNLAGEGTSDVYNQEVTIYADNYLPVDDTLIPTGVLQDVSGTVFDLRQSTKLGDVLNNVPGGGFDHNFCIRGPTGKRHAARVTHPASGRVLDVFTDQPGMQFYTGNGLDVTNGKNGHSYPRHSGFAMETQNYPDAINHANFPDSVLRPGSEYQQKVWYKFSTV